MKSSSPDIRGILKDRESLQHVGDELRCFPGEDGAVSNRAVGCFIWWWK